MSWRSECGGPLRLEGWGVGGEGGKGGAGSCRGNTDIQLRACRMR